MSDSGAAFAALLVVAAAYCVGGIHGLLMAWSQPARMRRWARLVDQQTEKALGLGPVERPIDPL